MSLLAQKSFNSHTASTELVELRTFHRFGGESALLVNIPNTLQYHTCSQQW